MADFNINLEKQLKEILDEFEGDVTEATKKVVKEVGRESAKKLRQTSPVGKTGRYAKGWTYKTESGRLTNSATVYGKKQTYPLAHLLEHGHARRGGGRTAAIVHIKPVEEWAVKEFEARLRKEIEA